MKSCPRASWWFGGCRFEPRYERKPRMFDDGPWYGLSVEPVPGAKPADAPTAADLGAVFASPRYIGDICIRCGAWSKDLVPKQGERG